MIRSHDKNLLLGGGLRANITSSTCWTGGGEANYTAPGIRQSFPSSASSSCPRSTFFRSLTRYLYTALECSRINPVRNSKVVPIYAMKLYGRFEIWLHSFLGSELDWSGQLHALTDLSQNKIKIHSRKKFLNVG